jgi:hypothetical protein
MFAAIKLLSYREHAVRFSVLRVQPRSRLCCHPWKAGLPQTRDNQ